MNKKILIVDDDSGISEAIKIMLEINNYEVAVVTDGSLVYNTIKKEEPDLLLLDLWMSGADGKKICQKLKSQDSTKNIPVIIISADSKIKDVSKDSGADDYIEKPFEIDDLLKKIKNHLKKS